MKRLLCLILACVLVLPLLACNRETEKIEEPVNFYYRRSQITFGTVDGVIAPYIAESKNHSSLDSLLQLYLQGAKDDAFAHTFPNGTQLLGTHIAGPTVHISLTNDFARLSGIDLKIACACLTMTVLELVEGVKYVSITANRASMDGSMSITLSLNDLLLMDTYAEKPVE